MDSTFLQARITATQAQIIAYEEVILSIAADGTQEYRLDTGQSMVRVQKLDLPLLQKTLDGLYNRCATLEARLNGSGTFTGVPVW